MSITLRNISKKYDKQTVLENISLDIQTGELFVLLGASGSGKSTLLRLIAGLMPMDNGTIALNKQDVTHLPPQARNTGFVFQNYSLFKHMTVTNNIAFGLEIRKEKTKGERQARVEELLELTGLQGLGNRYPNQLSGGQQQRVALARALAYEPSVLLLDEPFGALDVKIRGQLRQNLREIQQRLGVTAVLVTHDQEEAFELADRIGVIEKGVLLEVGTPNQLYRHPKNRFTATFLGSVNLLPAHRNSRYVHIGNTQLEAPLNSEHLSNCDVQVMIRPEDVELSSTPEFLRGQSIGRGVVKSVSFGGSYERVTVQLYDDRLNTPLIQTVLSPSDRRSLNIETGHDVWVGVKDYHLVE
jgi:sulfate transport system ATP-binding protein